MTKLELRNTRTAKPLFVDAKGAVFGREGGDADVKLADQGVSKKHARIYVRKGEWWLEDLNSANGTYVDDQRISQPVLLAPGLVFTMSRQQFEVVEVVEAQDEATQAPKLPEEGPDSTQEDEVPQDEPLPPPRRAPSGKPPPPPPGALRAKKDAPVASAARAKLQAAGTEADQEVPPEEDVEPGFNVGYFMKAVPRATAYYLGAVPLMLVNPIGFVRNGIDNQKVPAMGRMQIMAYTFPAQLITAAVMFVCSLVVQIVTGTISIGGIIPIVPLITAVVASIVAGFVYHPVLAWIVDKLQGESDARSRSNMFAMMMTTTVLLAIPNGLVVLFSIIRLPFVGIIPSLLSLAATLTTVFVVYSWFKSFGVVKWFQLGLLGLGALVVLGTGFSMIGAVTASLRGIGSGSTAAVAGAPTTPEEAQKAAEEAQAKAAKAQADAEKSSKAAVAANEQPAKVELAKVEPAKAEAEPAKVEVASAKVSPEAAPAKATPESAPAGSLSYPDYKSKLAELEKAVEDDPTVLQRADGLLAAYQQLHRAQFDAEDKVRRSQAHAHASQALVNQRLREAEVYKATSNLVEQVHQKLFAR